MTLDLIKAETLKDAMLQKAALYVRNGNLYDKEHGKELQHFA